MYVITKPGLKEKCMMYMNEILYKAADGVWIEDMAIVVEFANKAVACSRRSDGGERCDEYTFFN